MPPPPPPSPLEPPVPPTAPTPAAPEAPAEEHPSYCRDGSALAWTGHGAWAAAISGRCRGATGMRGPVASGGSGDTPSSTYAAGTARTTAPTAARDNYSIRQRRPADAEIGRSAAAAARSPKSGTAASSSPGSSSSYLGRMLAGPSDSPDVDLNRITGSDMHRRLNGTSKSAQTSFTSGVGTPDLPCAPSISNVALHTSAGTVHMDVPTVEKVTVDCVLAAAGNVSETALAERKKPESAMAALIGTRRPFTAAAQRCIDNMSWNLRKSEVLSEHNMAQDWRTRASFDCLLLE